MSAQFLQHMNTLIAPLATISLEGLGAMALYALVGTGLAIVGYKLFDRATPGDLHEEIIKNRNTAAAIVGAAVIIGVCLIVAAAIVG
jgi:putative membrane protein